MANPISNCSAPFWFQKSELCKTVFNSFQWLERRTYLRSVTETIKQEWWSLKVKEYHKN